jgi:hypothetical protein
MVSARLFPLSCCPLGKGRHNSWTIKKASTEPFHGKGHSSLLLVGKLSSPPSSDYVGSVFCGGDDGGWDLVRMNADFCKNMVRDGSQD